eukprot:scaffold1581_cov169-Amphora_coffeaeformis.AAC.8
MGLCHSTHKKHRLQEDISGPDSPLRPLKEKDTDNNNDSKFQDSTETTSTETDLDTTLPMSPESLLSPGGILIATTKTPKTKHLPDDSPGGDQPVVDTTPPSFRKFNYTFESKNTRKGRALQARLEKARLRQMVSSSPNNNTTANKFDTPVSDTGSFSSFLDYTQDDETDDDSLGGLPSMRYTLSNETTRSRRSNSLNEEFEATIQKGMIWAEIEQEDKVLAVALSRQTPTLEQSTPPLFLAVGGQDGRISVNELLEGGPFASGGARLGATLTLERKGRVRTLDFSPDGQFLAIGGDDGICALASVIINQDGHLQDLSVEQEVKRTDRIYAMQFSPDGRYLAVGGYDDAVAIVSLPTSSNVKIVAEIPTEGLVLSLDWSPDGNYLAIGGSDKRCLIIDTQNKVNWSIAYEIRRSSPIQALQWHPKAGRYLAIGANDVAIIDRETFQLRHEVGVNGKVSAKSQKSNGTYWNVGHSRSHDSTVSRINNLCWSPTGGYLVINASDGQCKMLETKSFSPIQDIQRPAKITSIVWGQHSVIAGVPHRYLAMGGEDKKVVILKAGIEISGGTSSIGDDISSSAGSYMSNRGEWVLKENTFREIDDGSLASMSAARSPKQRGGIVHALGFSRGSKSRPSAFFAIATGDGVVTIRSTLGWKILAQLEFLFPTNCLAFSNGSRMLALGGEDGKVRIVATSPLWTVMKEVNAESSIRSMAFSKNNERLVVGASDGVLMFFSPQENFAVAGECEENESTVLSIDWCTRYLAVGREDGSLSIYETDRIIQGHFTPITTIEGMKPLRSVAFGGGSKFLVAVADDGSAFVYSAVGSWALIHELHAGFPVTCLKWSPNGRHLAFAGEENQFKIMDTVFWAEVEGANRKEPPSATDTDMSRSPSFLSFSQDGRFLARACGKMGTRVVNTTTFDTILNLQTNFSDREKGETLEDNSDESDLSSPAGSTAE